MDTQSSENATFASLFGNNPAISFDERERVIAELQKIGSLTFVISKDANGWVAQCKEISGIIGGDTNPNPSDHEIEAGIREAVYAAFNVKIEEDKTRSPYFAYNDISVHTIRS